MKNLAQHYHSAIEALRKANRVCIISHLHPDADTIGSATALALGLEQLGKQTTILIGQVKEVSQELLSIPGAEKVKCVKVLPTDYDLYVTVDCGSVDRAGYLTPQLEKQEALVCFDHHVSNPGFAAINVVDPGCESTTAVLTPVLDALGIEITKDIAHGLYAGLLTDTGSFRWGRSRMHDLARRLIDYGLDTKQIAFDLIDSTSVADLKMLSRVLENVSVIPAGDYQLGILVATLSATAGASEAAVEGLINRVRGLKEIDIAVVFKEYNANRWTVSLRSSTVDCAAIAKTLGGGGHQAAAGYSTTGTIDVAINELVGLLVK